MSTGFVRADGRGCESYVRMSPTEAGDVHLAPGNQFLMGAPVREPPNAVSFGALSFAIPEGENLRLDKFEYRYRDGSILDDGGWLPFLSGGLVAAGGAEPDEDFSMSRRRVLMATGAAIGGGAMSMSQAAAADSRTLSIAEFSIESKSPQFELMLADDVAAVLPADQTYSVLADGVQIGELSPEKPSMSVPPGTRGEMSVLTEADMSRWQKVKSRLFGGPDEEQTFDLSLSKRASTFAEDETVTITDRAAVVIAIGDEGDDTALSIGGESIPHRDEDTDEDVGFYAVENGSLVYIAGTDPPDGTRVTLRAGIGRLSELKDDVSRVKS